MQAQKRHLESRVIAARQTLAYGLGRALIEARSLKGLLALPARLRTLRLRQKAKRRLRVPDTAPGDIAERLKLIDETLVHAERDGLAAAEQWLARQGDRARRGRALAELALFALGRGAAEEASAIGLRAAEAASEEPRLLAVIARLQSTGAVTGPAAIARPVIDSQPLSPPQRTWLEGLIRDAALLVGEAPAARTPTKRARPAAPVTGLLLAAPDSWRDHPRIRAARSAGKAAGLSVGLHSASPSSPDAILHVFPDSFDFAERILAEREGGGPVLLDLAGLPREFLTGEESETARVTRLRLGSLVETADRVVARGPAVEGLVRSLGVEPHRLDDLWPGASPADEQVDVARSEFGIGDRPVIACVADLSDEEGPRRLLEEFRRLRADEAGSLVILGQGPAAPHLSQLAAELALGDAAGFLGLPAYDRWPALFGCLDLIVFPSTQPETLGSPVPLAMVLGATHGTPMLFGDPAWQSRTSDRLSEAPLGDDWKKAISQALARSRSSPRMIQSTALEALYADLAKS